MSAPVATALPPAAPTGHVMPAAPFASAQRRHFATSVLLPTVARKEGWGQALKRALRLGGRAADGRPGEATTQKISRHDDGRPITA
jgi:hypothetical protein